VLCKEIVDFPVPWYWLRDASLGIAVPVVISAVPNEDASAFVQPADQVDPLHPMDSSATRRMPGFRHW
jgi:hypothetical protein